MFGIYLMIAGAIVFYRIGQHEYGAGFITAGLSIIMWLLTSVGLGWGWMGYLAGQLALFAGMTWYNMRRIEKRGA